MNELQARLGPLPLWGWLVAGVALGGAALLFWRRKGGTSGATLGQSQQSGAQPNFNYSSLDPLTGVPYSVESQVNPNTGLPNYYNPPPPNSSGNIGPPPAPGPIITPPPAPCGPGTYPFINPDGSTSCIPYGQYPGGQSPPPPSPMPAEHVPGFQQPLAPPPYPTPSIGWPTYPGTR